MMEPDDTLNRTEKMLLDIFPSYRFLNWNYSQSFSVILLRGHNQSYLILTVEVKQKRPAIQYQQSTANEG